MACEILFETSPIALTAGHVTELSRAAASFSPGLRARVDYLLAIFAQGKEPEWNVVLPGE
jgi:hypothetical protein